MKKFIRFLKSPLSGVRQRTILLIAIAISVVLTTTGLHQGGKLTPLEGFGEGRLPKFHTGWQHVKTDPISFSEDLQETGTWMTIMFFITDFPPMPGDALALVMTKTDEIIDSTVFIDNVEVVLE